MTMADMNCISITYLREWNVRHKNNEEGIFPWKLLSKSCAYNQYLNSNSPHNQTFHEKGIKNSVSS